MPPYTDTPSPIISTLTSEARTNFARAALGEISFIVKGFAVGRGGYLDANPVLIDVIDPDLTALIDHFFPTAGGIKDFEAIEKPLPSTVVVNCRLNSDEAVSGLGEIGLWAETIFSTIPAEIGNTWLMAVSHHGLQTKTLRQAVLYRMIIQF